ncbi:hypothetical protein LX36DRAFT_256153 [Colletotrichum falcatum]|nr:hypothetical protein LX36DRAFT_256153 [Colletotrichum falcatum]
MFSSSRGVCFGSWSTSLYLLLSFSPWCSHWPLSSIILLPELLKHGREFPVLCFRAVSFPQTSIHELERRSQHRLDVGQNKEWHEVLISAVRNIILTQSLILDRLQGDRRLRNPNGQRY